MTDLVDPYDLSDPNNYPAAMERKQQRITQLDKLLRQIWDDWTAAIQDSDLTKSDGDEDRASFLQVSVETFVAVREAAK